MQTKEFPQYQPMRSLIYVDCVKEEYRHRLQHWLYHVHVPDSISQFSPYVSKYAFYSALPMPMGGEKFGTVRMQLTEHYWNVNPTSAFTRNKAFTETFTPDVLRWQGKIPEINEQKYLTPGNAEDVRASLANNGMPPFIFAFVPVWWEEDIKGHNRMACEGPNYRWQFMICYPESISEAEGEKWLLEYILPWFKEQPEVNRLLSSHIFQSVNNFQFQRVVEMWLDGPEEWSALVSRATKEISKPLWAQTNEFPYLRPAYNITSIFTADTATSDNLTQYRGRITMR